MGGVLAQHFNRCNRNISIFAVVCMVIAGVMAYLLSTYYHNFFFGPFEKTPKELSTLKDVDEVTDYFISIPAENLIDTGWREGKKGRENIMYMMVPAGKRMLLIKSPIDSHGADLSGVLVDIPTDVYHDVVDYARINIPAAKDRVFLSFMLDANRPFRFGGYIGLAVIALLTGTFLWLCFLLIMRAINPLSHPVMVEVGKYGDPNEIAQQINDDFANEPAIKIGSLQISPNWLIHANTFGIRLAVVKDIVWAYKKVVKGDVNQISAVIYTRDQEYFEVVGKGNQVDQMLTAIYAQVPWAIPGFDPALLNLWNSNVNEFLSIVDERKRKMESGEWDEEPPPEEELPHPPPVP